MDNQRVRSGGATGIVLLISIFQENYQKSDFSHLINYN